MLLYSFEVRTRKEVVALFGVGLIGSAISRELRRQAELRGTDFSCELLPFGWRSGEEQELHFRALGRRLESLLGRSPSAPRLQFVWTAGRAGFGSSEAEVEPEVENLRRVIDLLARVSRLRPDARLGFHLLSSAGGLFEGQRCVDRSSAPRPMRPYGASKLAQENILERADFIDFRRIYRVTSVYGTERPGQRIGLPTVLLLNGLRARVTSIHGAMNTLRDYVWVGDVAGHLIQALLQTIPEPGLSVEFLASSRPTTLFEVKSTIEGVLGRQLYVTCSLEPSNADHITFSPPVTPQGWSPIPLVTGVERVYRSAIWSGIRVG